MWSYPLRDGDLEETRMNMVNVLLLRIHQSGHLAELSPERRAAVDEAIAVYKNIRHHIRDGLPLWPLGPALFGCEHAASAIEDGDTILVAVWRFHGSADIDLPIQHWQGTKDTEVAAECLYPANASPCTWNSEAATLSVNLEHETSARLFRIHRNSCIFC